ncbi:heterokaryon incompatibility protein-domain-containing protein [Hypoxylon rubiginosum]|uniref:Heterokaryon incompatibility protein-domain-containing protein n=1 Tax=Hypoxylon rubiginosum TaxID=110542 RepID=A0ACB9YLS5_9PEZI|nr:heterokaryon incompatibility protein-domain-containing protein [Hypoxylon rubiginosum]
MYLQLSGPEQRFRLLLLLPGDTSSDIQCQLFVSPLDCPSGFEALSYVWGDSKDTTPITFQGQTHHVTRNLYSALRSLRYPDRERTLWVDALCINQDDTDERNHQVKLMGQIYSSAKCVVAWLGKARPRDSDIIRFVTVASDPNLHWTDLVRESHPLSLLAFLNGSWWDRVWTAVRAQNLIYQRGNLFISRETVTSMLLNFNTHLTSCCISVHESWGREPGFDDLMRLIRLQRELEHVRIGRYGKSFSQVIGYIRHRNATNPRDKVYGLLGMINDAQNITVDYNLLVEMAYERSAREIITETRNLDLFCSLFQKHGENLTRPNSKAINLPSWVLDWTRDFNTVHNRDYSTSLHLRTLSLFNACGSRPFNASNGNKQGSLRASGIVFDVVEQISPSFMNMGKEPKAIRDWRNMAGVEKEPDKPYPSGGTILDAFWRTLSLDLSCSRKRDIIPTKRAGLEDRKIHDFFWFLSLLPLYDRPISDRFPESFQNRLEGNAFWNHIHQTAYDRRFFFSKRGYMGLAPENVKLGDFVCVLAGGRLPFILRSTEAVPGEINDDSEAETVCTIAVKKIDERKESFQTFRLT